MLDTPSPPPLEQTNNSSSPLEQIIISKTPKNQLSLSYNNTPRKLATLGTSKLQKTKPSVCLNAVYFDSTQYLNGEFTLLTNFSNRRVHVKFESLVIELFYSDRLISTQSIKPFTQKPRERRLQSVKLISNLVFLPQDVGVKLQKQVQNNRLNYYAKGTFKVRVNMGIIHFSFLLHSVCQMEMTAPPAGALLARQCNTFR